MIQPSALNVLIIGLSTLVFAFIWRFTAAYMHDKPLGQAMAVVL